MKSGDDLTFWVCNPNSGKCKTAKKSFTGSGSGQLKVIIDNNDVPLSYDIYIDDNKMGEIAGVSGSYWLDTERGTARRSTWIACTLCCRPPWARRTTPSRKNRRLLETLLLVLVIAAPAIPRATSISVPVTTPSAKSSISPPPQAIPGRLAPRECVAASLAWIDARDVFRLVRLVRDNALLLTELGLKAALDQCRLTGATLVLPSWIG